MSEKLGTSQVVLNLRLNVKILKFFIWPLGSEYSVAFESLLFLFSTSYFAASKLSLSKQLYNLVSKVALFYYRTLESVKIESAKFFLLDFSMI